MAYQISSQPLPDEAYIPCINCSTRAVPFGLICPVCNGAGRLHNHINQVCRTCNWYEGVSKPNLNVRCGRYGITLGDDWTCGDDPDTMTVDEPVYLENETEIANVRDRRLFRY